MKVETAFFCDDVRKEDNGKQIFIGCYASDIRLGDRPTVERPLIIHLKLVICGQMNETDEIEIEITLNGKSMVRGKMKAKIEFSSFVLLPVPLEPLIFTETGNMLVKSKSATGKWKVLREIEVTSPAISSPTS